MTSKKNVRPLLTFALMGCNQAQYVGEGVQAALAQTYSPLEVILSDDCSDDGSFEIMKGLADSYRGPHKVLLNRNPTRVKMGGHMNRVAALANGEMIVIAAADDISMPDRTEVLYRTWEEGGRLATSIYSDVVQIDENGKEVDWVFKGERHCEPGKWIEEKTGPLEYIQTLKPAIHGCSHAISPQLFKIFGGLLEDVVYEDKVLGFRSAICGKIVFLNEPLVRYRLHSANILKYIRNGPGPTDLKGLEAQEAQAIKEHRNAENMYHSFECDLEKAKAHGIISGTNFNNLCKEAGEFRRRFACLSNYYQSGFLAKCRILSKLRQQGFEARELRSLTCRLLPQTMLFPLRIVRNRIQNSRQRV